MESLSRPPHRRKHSAAFSASFSFKNPYDDVLLSSGGKKKSFEAHEYTEMFSGASSIPLLDLSGLDERVGSGDGRSSKLDYSNIFGGLRNDDVAVPYEELVNASAKTKPPRTPTVSRLPSQESGSQHSSGKIKRSSPEASDQSVDGVKQQVNMSFNRTSQRDNDASNGKTHIAQLHAVPGFTYFVDGNSRLQKTEEDRPIPSLKRGVSRTWSFSAELESVKGKGGLSGNKSHIPDKSFNDNKVNLKSHFSKVPPSDDNDPRRSRASSFGSKQDASEKIAGESSPSFLDEEFDENSVAAVSAAALKKAIDQAQESIRIAKMIMDRKKQGLQDGSKPSSRGRLKVKDKKETKIDHEAYGSKEKNVWGKNERSDLINAGKAEVERVRENVGAAEEHAEAFNREGKVSAPSCSQHETLRIDGKVELEKLGKNVETAEVHRVVAYFPGLVADTEFRTEKLGYGQVGNDKSLLLSTDKIASHVEEMEAAKETFEQRKVNVDHKGPDVVDKPSERALDASKRMEEPEKSVEEALEQCQASFNHAKGHTHIDEQENILDEAGEYLRIILENEVTQGREIVTDDKEKSEKKFEVCAEMLNVKYLTAARSEFDSSLNESGNLVKKEAVEQEETGKDETVPEWKENGLRHGKSDVEEELMGQKEAHIWFESEEQLKEALDEEIYEWKPKIRPEIGQFEEPEIDDKKQNHAYDEKKQMLPGKLEQIEVDEKHTNTHEYEATEDVVTEANNFVEAQKDEVLPYAEETNNIVKGAGSSEENRNKCQEFAYEKDIDEAIDANNSDASTVFSESQEACDVDLNNRTEDYQEEVISVPGVTKTFSAMDKDKEADQLFHLEDNEMPGIDSLHRSASEEIFFESKLYNSFEVPSANAKTENFIDTEADNEMPGIDSLHRSASEEIFFESKLYNSFEVPSANAKTVNFIETEADNEMPGIDSLHRSASEEIFFESKLYNSFEVPSANAKTENFIDTDSDHEEKLPNKDTMETMSEIHDASQGYADKIDLQNLPQVNSSNNKTEEFDLAYLRQMLEQNSESDKGSASTSSVENIDGLSAHESEECAENVKDKTADEEKLKYEIEMTSNESKYNEEQSEEMDKSMETERAVGTGLNVEKNRENHAKENVQNFDKNDHQQRIEAIKRGREREKDRIAVERAIREARERAFAEARERAERAAVERAAAEVRQRVMSEAREKLEKVNKQPADKASTEAKLRAERAAVERATAEARERALEKAMSQKISGEAKTQADKYTAERLSSSSKNNGLKHSFSSSDLEKLDGSNNESAQRRKARLERHQRIMERAAKALAEKNMRDLLVQKEQAERNRLAESLDADIKRWATGKEGNLRALLSTLQYILGADSGWQPISLTEIITTVAVKKAYRKATLYVHPDKLQQRGATIQQKYICEKVFDLLKAAWNRFNSEER
ncbi:hypothetical protein BUALT_Bualt08G0073400 [Buddleja alternifolia]|uniref:J domain-containing protein n=1 Tax=Buddleja alternifolia TaxID=168488 RepID=A0AAV6XFI4_9LAMI|nr:hypothetical protein BUALT_Bualt08G0073400 [Buddleja alternifolia]